MKIRVILIDRDYEYISSLDDDEKIFTSVSKDLVFEDERKENQ